MYHRYKTRDQGDPGLGRVLNGLNPGLQLLSDLTILPKKIFVGI
jgi:hypothetical protein